MAKLNSKIFLKLKKKFPNKTENNIRVTLSQLSRKHRVPLNTAAEILAKKEGFSVWGLLNDKEKGSLNNKDIQIIKLKKSPNKKRKSIVNFVDYETKNKFLKFHLDEINKCYSCGCYTAAFILIRKILENLIVDMITHKFPTKSKSDR